MSGVDHWEHVSLVPRAPPPTERLHAASVRTVCLTVATPARRPDRDEPSPKTARRVAKTAGQKYGSITLASSTCQIIPLISGAKRGILYLDIIVKGSVVAMEL